MPGQGFFNEPVNQIELCCSAYEHLTGHLRMVTEQSLGGGSRTHLPGVGDLTDDTCSERTYGASEPPSEAALELAERANTGLYTNEER